MKKTVSDQKLLLRKLSRDEAFRLEYLNQALAHEDQRMILQALRNVAKVAGGMTQLAKRTGFNRQHLYLTLSGKGNPTWVRIEKIFDGLGYPLRAIAQKIPASPEKNKGK